LEGTGAGGDLAYIIQNDPLFSQLKAWGNIIWQLLQHNMNVKGAAPFLMTQHIIETPTVVIKDEINAFRSGSAIEVYWRTLFKTNITGFNIHRSDSFDGKFT
jgi:hypothetical protein